MASWLSRATFRFTASPATWSLGLKVRPRRPKIPGGIPVGSVGGHQDQPKGLRLDLERRARNRWHPRWRRGDHHARRAVREGLNYPRRLAHIKAACFLAEEKGTQCHSAQLDRSVKRSPPSRAPV